MHAYEASRARDQDFHLLQATSACESNRRGLSASPTGGIRVKRHARSHRTRLSDVQRLQTPSNL
jgi:hypothetical protein